MSPKPHDDSSPPAKPNRPKRRLKRWGITALVLLLLGFVINGPGARWLVGKVLRDQLTKQELSGDFAVAGTLASGFTLTDLRLTGTGPLRKVSADKIELQWRLTRLRHKQFDLAAIEGVRVELLPGEKDEDKPEGDWRDIFESLRKFRDIAISGEIRLTDIQVTVLGEDGARQVTLASLRHTAGSGQFQVEGFFPGNLLPEPPPVQDFTIQWNDSEIVLSEFSVTPGLAIAGFTLNYQAGSPINAATTLDFLEKHFEVRASETGTLVIRSGETPLDLTKVLEVLGLDYPLEGKVAELSINLDGLLEAPAQWQGDLAIRADDLVWNERPVPALSLTGRIEDNEVIAGLKAGDELVVLDLVSELPATRDGRVQWTGHKVATELKVRSMSELATLALQATGQEIPAALPDGNLTVKAPLELAESGLPETVDLEWSTREVTYRDQDIPALTGSASFADKKLSAKAAATLAAAGDKLEIGGGYDLEKKSYHGDLTLSLRDSAWLGRLALAEEKLAKWRPVGPLGITWNGTGSLVEKTHSGSYHLETVSVKAPEESTTNASLKGAYAWPESVTAETIAIRNGELQLAGGVAWSPHIVTFRKLILEDGDGELATIDGRSPANPDLKALFQTEEPIALTVQSKKLTLARIRTLIPLPLDEAYQATFDADLKLLGPPAEPSLTGTLNISGIKTPFAEAPPLALATTFATAAGELIATSTLRDDKGALAGLRASVPVKSQQWADNPEVMKQLPFTASLKAETLGLDRLKSLSDALKDAEGSIDLDLTASGTISEPSYEGSASLKLTRYPLPNTPHREIRDTTFTLKLEPGKATIEPSKCTIAGGTMILSGVATYGGETPTFDLRLDAENALLWRDDLMVARTSGFLTLVGTLQEARLSGELGIVDSLFFKDIELIPLRPATSVAPPSLPSFSTRGASKEFTLPVPEPMANWPLAVEVFTKDSFLIRGNLATGEATGKISVGGTLARPKPSGRIDLKKAVADLPFSRLTISNGSVVLRPEAPTNPVIEVRGRTVVDTYDINAYVYGPVSKLNYNLASDPPLPDSEIMSLISTGTTTQDLTNPDVAQARAFQLVLDDARRRANSAEAGPTMKLLKKPLNAVDDLNLRVGQNDPYSGRRFNSATLELTDKWSATIQLDDEGNTRGLLRFSIRSK